MRHLITDPARSYHRLTDRLLDIKYRTIGTDYSSRRHDTSDDVTIHGREDDQVLFRRLEQLPSFIDFGSGCQRLFVLHPNY